VAERKDGSKVVVLDTWAMLAYLGGEPAATDVRQALRRARKKQIIVLFSIINYGESLYIIEREQGLEQAQHAIGIIDQLAIRTAPVDRQLVFDAAHIKARFAVSYADAFCIALAKHYGGQVMTADPQFAAFETEIDVHWLSDRRK